MKRPTARNSAAVMKVKEEKANFQLSSLNQPWILKRKTFSVMEDVKIEVRVEEYISRSRPQRSLSIKAMLFVFRVFFSSPDY